MNGGFLYTSQLTYIPNKRVTNSNNIIMKTFEPLVSDQSSPLKYTPKFIIALNVNFFNIDGLVDDSPPHILNVFV